jgi:hypothetical protein
MDDCGFHSMLSTSSGVRISSKSDQSDNDKSSILARGSDLVVCVYDLRDLMRDEVKLCTDGILMVMAGMVDWDTLWS